MPQACTLMRTSPALGLGISRSTISKSAPALGICATFIGVIATPKRRGIQEHPSALRVPRAIGVGLEQGNRFDQSCELSRRQTAGSFTVSRLSRTVVNHPRMRMATQKDALSASGGGRNGEESVSVSQLFRAHGFAAQVLRAGCRSGD